MQLLRNRHGKVSKLISIDTVNNTIPFYLTATSILKRQHRIGMDIIINAAKQLCNYHLKSLREFLADSISTVRLSLTTGKNENILTSGMNLNEVIMNFYVSTVEKVKGVLQDLTVSISFTLNV